MLCKRLYKSLSVLCFILLGSHSYADTMDHYMNIVNNIPKMEIKADGQAQIWAKSARNVVLLTCESVAESLIIANTVATSNHTPLFCLPPNVVLDGANLQGILQQAYSDLPNPESEKAKMTVSEVALLGLTKLYPCPQTQPQTQAKQPEIRIHSMHRRF